MRSLLLACATMVAGCSGSDTFINPHAGVQGTLTLTTRGLTHQMLAGPQLTFDAGLDQSTTLLRLDVQFADTNYPFFYLYVTSALRVGDVPTLVAPFTYTAEYPDQVQGTRAELPLTGSLRANDLFLVCNDEPATPCAVGTPNGRLEVATSSLSVTRVQGALTFTTDPRVEEVP